MGIKDLEFTNHNLGEIIDLRLAELRKGRVHPKHVLDVARCYRYLGCGLLLSGHDAVGFFYCLFLAADAWGQFLERKAHWPDLDTYYLARARAEPLLDALALGDVELVRRLDALVDTERQAGAEYEEDYWFLRLLPRMLTAPADAGFLSDGLDRMERALEGITYPRYDVLRALERRDEKGFDQALRALTEAWKAEFTRQRKGGLGNPYALSTEAHVFIEGLAVVRVARARGLKTDPSYPFIPPISLGRPQPGMQRLPIWGG